MVRRVKERINGYCNWKWLLGFWLIWILKHFNEIICIWTCYFFFFLKQFRIRVSCGLQKNFENDFWESISHKIEREKNKFQDKKNLIGVICPKRTQTDQLTDESERKTENEKWSFSIFTVLTVAAIKMVQAIASQYDFFFLNFRFILLIITGQSDSLRSTIVWYDH